LTIPHSPRPIPKTGSSTTRSARSVSATAYSIAVWKVGSRARASTVVIIQSSPSTGWRPPSSEVAALVNAWKHRYITWPASRYGRRLRSPGSPFVTPGANTWRYPAPGCDTSISRSVSGGWNATAICVIGDATVMWTSAGTARSGRLKPRRQPRRRSRSPVRPVGTGKIWPVSGGRSRGPAPAAIRGL
jgi:hypothetical protein